VIILPQLRKRIWKSGKVTWDIRYWESGKRRVHTIGETDRRTAEKIFHKFCARFAEGGVDGIDHRPEDQSRGHRATLSDLAEFTKAFAESNKSKKTQEREQLALHEVIRGIGNVPLLDLTPSRIEEYKAARLQKVRPATVNIEIRILNTAINQAMEMGLMESSVRNNFKQIKIPDTEPPKWLTEDEIAVLLNTPDQEFQAFLKFLLYTGCRRNEALGLTWDDIDLERKQIVIRGEIGKMGKRRTVPVNTVLREVLSNIPGPHHGLLFPNYAPNQVSMKFRRWAKQIGMHEKASLHTLRSTFACHLIRQGVDIYVVSRLLGHSSVRVTEKHYVTVDSQHVQAAVDLLDFNRR
jgi:integrase